MIKVFLSYSHIDEKYRDELAKHLNILKRLKIIETWHDRRILPGEDWSNSINENLNNADIILLLVSVDFINSEYCFELEMNQAIARHESGEAVVIPIIIRPCLWQRLPFGKFQTATRDGKPVEKYPSYDDAFLEVCENIEIVARQLGVKKIEEKSEPISEPTGGDGKEFVKPEAALVIKWAQDHNAVDPYNIGPSNWERCLHDLGYKDGKPNELVYDADGKLKYQ
jgi:hypothetical protein